MGRVRGRQVSNASPAEARRRSRYWPTVAPVVRTQIRGYTRHACRIGNPVLQTLALAKLDDQRFHAQVAATLATLAPRRYRRDATQAIVAIEVIYDYLDALTERPSPDPLRDGRRLFQALADAVRLGGEPQAAYCDPLSESDDQGYLCSLVADARHALERLPAAHVVEPIAQRCTARFSEAQIRAHAIPTLGVAQLRDWAAQQAAGTGLEWRGYFAGATSTVLGLHALIAAAADPGTTRQEAAQIDALYLHIGLIVTILDSVVDYRHDVASTGEPGYVRFYESSDRLLQELAGAVRNARELAHGVPHAPHHLMTLAGVVAFYTSAPTAGEHPAAEVSRLLRRELRPLMAPTLAVMRAWRLAKRMRTVPATASPTMPEPGAESPI